MKGLESMPIKYLVVCVVLAIVLGVGFWQMGYFFEFKLEKDFKEDITILAQNIKMTRDSGDYNTFTTIPFTVPSNYNFTINISSDTLIGGIGDKIFEPILKENITAVRLDGDVYRDVNESINFISGSVYELTLFYGIVDDDQIKEMTIVFE